MSNNIGWYNKATKLFLLVLAIFSPYFISAQETGQAIVLVSPRKATTVLRLDTALLTNTKQPFDLRTGTYILRAWAPKRELLIDTLQVENEKVCFYKKKLNYSQEYLKYRKTLSVYRTKQYLPGAALIAYTSISASFYSNNHRHQQDYLALALKEKDQYESSVSLIQIDHHKAEYEKYKKLYDSFYNKNKAITISSMVVLPLGFACAAWLVYKTIKTGKPVYNETPLLSEAGKKRKFTIHPTLNGIYIEM